MKEITLRNSSKKAQVDDEDYAYINQFEWFLTKKGYAARIDGDDVIYMHDDVMNRARKLRAVK